MHALLETVIFLVTTGGILFLPGFVILHACFKKDVLSPIETGLFSFALSLGLLDFLMILFGKSGILFTKTSLSIGIIVSSIAIIIIGRIVMLFTNTSKKQGVGDDENIYSETKHGWNKKQGALFVILIALTILIKTIYLSHAIIPTATDLGHHMYWAKLTSQTKTLPTYAQIGRAHV